MAVFEILEIFGAFSYKFLLHLWKRRFLDNLKDFQIIGRKTAQALQSSEKILFLTFIAVFHLRLFQKKCLNTFCCKLIGVKKGASCTVAQLFLWQ